MNERNEVVLMFLPLSEQWFIPVNSEKIEFDCSSNLLRYFQK